MPETKRVLAIDLDGTLARFDSWRGVEHFGKPYAGAVDFIEGLSRDFDIVIHTCRTNPVVNDTETPEQLAERVYKWLKENGFPDTVKVWAGSGKPIASLYLDDRGFRCEPKISSDTTLYYRDIAREIRLSAIS